MANEAIITAIRVEIARLEAALAALTGDEPASPDRTIEERRDIVRRANVSGNVTAFAREQGIPYQTLAKWRRAAKEGRL